ncbi:MAG: DUF3455 domain-containing protein [Terriglobales bacterium]
MPTASAVITNVDSEVPRSVLDVIAILTFIFILALPLAHAQKEAAPDVPNAIQAHPGEEVVLLAHASGSQIYTCQAGADGKFAWTLKAPDAELKDGKGKVIGSHFAGPSWKLSDSSEVTGKAAAHVDSPDSDSIPWLLVNVVSHSGTGLLTNVTSIQRVHTHGGKAPAGGCDEAHRGAETKISYTADYYFYAPAKSK